MPKYRVDPRTTRTVEMADGTRYPVPASGWVSVGHQHEAEMNRSPTQVGNVNGESMAVRLSAPRLAGRPCATCSFVGWPWQQKCPRCGAPLT